jgi:hypothetical protein
MDVPGLKRAVVEQLPAIFGRWEGPGLPFMYPDVKGIVTTGTGNALFSVEAAQALPWENPDGTRASPATIAAAYQTVKAAWPGVQSVASARLTNIRLPPSALADLVRRTIAQMWGALCLQFRGCQDWPADAQLALLSVSWAWGAYFLRVWDGIPPNPAAVAGAFVPSPGYGYGSKFRELLGAPPEFGLAAGIVGDASAGEEKRNPGIVPRDHGTVLMLQNAAAVLAAGSDPEVLHYPSAA